MINVPDSTVVAIGQFLGTLNNIAKILNQSSNGIFNVSIATDAAGPMIMSFFNQLQAAGISHSQMASALNSGQTEPVLTTSADAQYNLTQGVNGTGFIGTVWTEI